MGLAVWRLVKAVMMWEQVLDDLKLPWKSILSAAASFGGDNCQISIFMVSCTVGYINKETSKPFLIEQMMKRKWLWSAHLRAVIMVPVHPVYKSKDFFPIPYKSYQCMWESSRHFPHFERHYRKFIRMNVGLILESAFDSPSIPDPIWGRFRRNRSKYFFSRTNRHVHRRTKDRFFGNK